METRDLDLAVNDGLVVLLAGVTKERDELKIMLRRARRALVGTSEKPADSIKAASILNMYELSGPPDAVAIKET